MGRVVVYTNPAQPELRQVVREGDCVLMPKGYHPNVAAPASDYLHGHILVVDGGWLGR